MARRRPPRHVYAIGAEVVTPAGPGVVVAYVTAGAAEADGNVCGGRLSKRTGTCRNCEG